VHEPPLLGLGGEGALGDIIAGARMLLESVADEIASGATESGTRRFVEQVSLGPGAWEILPAAMRESYMASSGTFVQEAADPLAWGLEVDALSDFPGEVQVTRGDVGGVLFEQLVERLADLLPGARRDVIEGAGHAPHLSHPDQLARTVAGHCLAAA
jgi:pimeloyl-ACP methyl ester carboxylesterase